MSDSLTLYGIWWPHPEAIKDLSVSIEGEEFQLEAPHGTECAAWLSYYNETDERREAFSLAFFEVLKESAEKYLKEARDGKNEDVLDGAESDPVEAEDDFDRAQPEHQLGFDGTQ